MTKSEEKARYLLPVGVSDYRILVTHRNSNNIGYLFVDKSLLIKGIDDDGATVILVTRPRRFGKTLALSMLRYFFAKEIAGELTAGLFDGTEIAKDKNVMQHQGQYPVIFISFKGIKASNYASAKSHIKEELRILYEEFRYLVDAENFLSKDEKNIYASILAKKVEDIDLEKAIYHLTLYLNRYHKVKPFLLIDEYDTPIQSAYMKDYYGEMVELMRGMFEAALKDNENITKAVLTGITRVAKESLFSGVNNFEIYTLLSNKYKECFGFTEAEVNALFGKSQIPLNEQEIKDWYNGYKCNDLLIYNPWSIIKCLNNAGEIDSYWVNTSSNELAVDLLIGGDLEVHEKLEDLLQGKAVMEDLDVNIVYNNIKDNKAAIWTLLFMTGYLKVTSYTKNLSSGLNRCELALPNKEVRYFYRNFIQVWLSSKKGGAWYQNFIYDLLEARVDRFEEKLQSILLNTFSFQDVNKKNQETFYHGFMLGLIAVLQDTHIVKSNRESGEGRYDVSIIPHDKNEYGIVLEFKAATEGSNIDFEAKQALQQIKEAQYNADLQQLGFKKILNLGIAFSHKNVRIIAEKAVE